MSTEGLTQQLMGPPLKIHLLGVAGSGMSGIAALLLALGHQVSGSDRAETMEVDRLAKKGLCFSSVHTAEEVRGVDIVVYSSAVKEGNPAYDEARRLGKPMYRRADILSAMMSAKKGIVVCGMHGKTTTSALLAHGLRVSGWKPSHYVGAEIPVLGTNARWDSEGEFFVAEGDESDGTLVNYHPEYAIVLNIEPEHLDFYPDLEAIDAVYRRLISQTRGKVVYCGDDPGAARVCSLHPSSISYGFGGSCSYRLEILEKTPLGSRFRIFCREDPLGDLTLGIPGRHNALNALGVLVLCLEMGTPLRDLCTALASFRGARRRFEVKYDADGLFIVDDYGHHPTEIEATLATARDVAKGRVLTLFQPHRYSRTVALKERFGEAFDQADILWVSDIYPAGEKPIPGVSGQWIVDAVKAHGYPRAQFVADLPGMSREAARWAQEGDLILTLGAGNIHECGIRLAEDWVMRKKILEMMGAGEIRLYEPLSRHTTLRVGGPAQFWVEPESEEGFAELARWCFDEDIPFMVIGRGSNLLVRDGGIPGVVAHLIRGDFARVKVEGTEITAGVGVKLKQLVAEARKAGLGGFEWMEGIPGNLGGALRMNAGAMGGQTFDRIARVRMIDTDGNIFSRSPKEMEIRYRNVPSLRKNFAISAVFEGAPATVDEIDARVEASKQKRRASQPIGASAGCIFKNPSEIPAGKLVEELGLKNFCVGKARVSEVHGNFVVNDGGATAEEMITLIEEIQSLAKEKRGIQLETEVQIVGVEA